MSGAIRQFSDGNIEYETDYEMSDHDCPDIIGVQITCRRLCKNCGHTCSQHSHYDGNNMRCVADIAEWNQHDTCHCPKWEIENEV